MQAKSDKLIVITKETSLDALIHRFNTRAQARFYIRRMRADFTLYESAHEAYTGALASLRDALPKDMRVQWIDRSFLPNFTFGDSDLVVTFGPDGLVVNAAKYLDGQPLIAINPDPSRIDGVLLPFTVADASEAIAGVRNGRATVKQIAMARAELNDGQTILAVNDLFIGQRTHVSARYTLQHRDCTESQSSSGIIVSTGAGSTGWYRSVLAGASGILSTLVSSPDIERARQAYQFDWEARRLVFSVREPFASKVTGASLVHGEITPHTPLMVTSEMPQNGVIFSDGVEEDFLAFNSGAIATVGLAEKTLRLVVRPDGASDTRRSEPISRSTRSKG